MDQFQGWAVHISWCADHTYVAVPNQNQFFECWGQHYTPPDQVLICSGNGNYNTANCYRCPVDLFGTIYPDTACVGAYGVNGVCHQSANCFLIETGQTLTFAVRGYWFSLMMYGTYGTIFFPWWYLAVFTPCRLRFGVAAPAAEEAAMAANPSLPDQIRKLHEDAQHEPVPPSRNEMLIREAALVTSHYAPDVDPARHRDLHAAMLADKDAALASGAHGAELAARLNEVAAMHQARFAERLGASAYQQLMGAPPGERVNIIEPAAEAATGVAPPRHTPGNTT
jgi:hypothetical protein